MKLHHLSGPEWAKAVLVGLLTAVLLSAVMVPAAMAGLSPMPKPLGVAFAATVLTPPGEGVPIPVGLAFHAAWVTLWSVVYVALFRDRLTFGRAAGLALALWVVVLVVFFPIVGWGFFGLAVSPMLIVGSLVPHLLFAVFLWGLCRLIFRDRSATAHA